jgi:type II secretory pathway pseudopilin PulG
MRRSAALTLVELLIVIAIVGIVIALLLPMSRSSREAARRNSCMNNLKQVAIALHNYKEEHGTLPPAYTVDEQGNRLHSWRTLILPQLEQAALYKTIDLTKPWDDPANIKARETVVEVYQCPSSAASENLTNYLAVVSPNCAFAGSEARKLSDVTDGLEHTIGVVEVRADRAVPWMSPHDVGPDAVIELLNNKEFNHPGIMTTAFLDGHTTTVYEDIDPAILRGMLTIAGGEEIER